MFLKDQFLVLCFSLITLTLQLLPFIYNLSHTIHLLITYNCRCMLLLTKYLSCFTLRSCISNDKAWATANMFILNYNTTELILVTSKRNRHLHNLPTTIYVCSAHIAFIKSFEYLGLTLDCDLYWNDPTPNLS